MMTVKCCQKRILTIAAVAGCLALAGCATAPLGVEGAAQLMTGQPQPSPVRIAGSASVEVTYETDQGIRNYWKGRGFTDAQVDDINRLIAGTITRDLKTTGLFERIVQDAAAETPDYIVQLATRSYYNPEERFSIAITISPGAYPADSVSMKREVMLGGQWLGVSMAQHMSETKTAMAAGVERLKQAAVERTEMAAMRDAPLPDLLHAADRSVAIARERNRILVEAKTRQLPGILRDWKSEDLTSLVVRIEQTILDLDHECEVTKDQAQQAMAASEAGQGQAEALRGLAISYRERIELLKPMLAAIKGELTDRER